MRRPSSSSRISVNPGFTARGAASAVLIASAALAVLAGCGSGGVPQFDSASAFALLEEQVAIGHRYPGSPEHRELQRYLAGKLQEYGANVSLQPFDAVLTTGDTLHLVNIIGNYKRAHASG